MSGIPEIVLPANTDTESDNDDVELTEQWTEVEFEDHDHDISRLREAYEAAEVDRFLEYFETYVQEIRAPSASTQNLATPQMMPGESQEVAGQSNYKRSPEWSLSEEVAFTYILPNLPKTAPEVKPFTYGRLRLALQRLYLALEPVYIPSLTRIAHLALWEDTKISGIYCAIYWVLWFYNLILPSIVLWVLYNLAWRRVLPYPTVAELRHRQNEIAKADEFGDAIAARLTASSAVGLKEVWRIAKLFKKSKKDKLKSKSNASLAPPGGLSATPSPGVSQESLLPESIPDPTTEEEKKLGDIRQTAVIIMNEVADVHERIKNIFIWRRPASSVLYGSVILLIFFVTLLVPSQYLAKMLYFVIGLFYWHITPVIAALPESARARLPPALGDVPTDADYAMEIISKRVAAGLDVRPTRKVKRKTHSHSGSESTATVNDIESASRSLSGPASTQAAPGPSSSSVDWRKWTDRAHKGKTWALEGRRILTGKEREPGDIDDGTSAAGPSHTYPCNHTNTMAPGFITLTSAMFHFTPLTSMRPKLSIPLSSIRGVRKIFKGLSVQWSSVDEGTGASSISDDKFSFLLVGNSVREELFARLLGGDTTRWQRV